MLAYTYPLLDLFGSMLGFFLLIIWFWLLIIIFWTSSAAGTWAGGPRPCGRSSSSSFPSSGSSPI